MNSTPQGRRPMVNEPKPGPLLPRLREVLEYRDVLYVLVRRDVAVRYKQTVFGAAWAILQPALLATILSLFLGLVFERPPSGNVPYALFLLCGLTLWFYFSEATSTGSLSTLASAALISKVYFPRVIVPMSAVMAPLANFAFAFVVLIVTMVLYGLTPTARLLVIPLVLATTMLVALGLSLLFSALVVRFRDVQLGIPFVIQLLLYSSAVVHPLRIVPERIRPYLMINPMVGLMETVRWGVIPGSDSPGFLILVSVATALALVVAGLLYFERAEGTFDDVI